MKKSKFNFLDIAIVMAVVAIFFSIVMVYVKKLTADETEITIAITVSDKTASLVSNGDEVEFNGKSGKITAIRQMGENKVIEAVFSFDKNSGLPLIGQSISMKTSNVFFEGDIYSVTQKEDVENEG